MLCYIKHEGAVDVRFPKWPLQHLNFEECLEIKGQFDSLSKKRNPKDEILLPYCLELSCGFAVTSHPLYLLCFKKSVIVCSP